MLNEQKQKEAILQGVCSTYPQLQNIKVINRFAPGILMREMYVPKDSIVIGKTHKTEHLNMLIQGECVININGEKQIFKSYSNFTSQAGDKKFFLTITDIIFATVHPTEKTDIDEIELDIIDHEAEKELEYEFNQVLDNPYKLFS